MSKVKIYLVAGEPSGDLLGSRLMRALKKTYGRNVVFMGVGGETMTREGLNSLFDIKELAVMGLVEVLPSIPRILRRIEQVGRDILIQNPDIVITIDSYSFSARVHKWLKTHQVPVKHVHYVAPQVWAWKKKRADTAYQLFDHLFCLLPNEVPLFESKKMASTFVGHPVVESAANAGDAAGFRKKYHIPDKAFVMCMLPGSRKNEINYLLNDFMKTAELVRQKHPDLFVVVPTVQTVSERVEKALQNWPIPHVVVMGEQNRYDAFAAAQLALASSGTVSLELAMAGVPHIIAYRVSRLTAAIVRRLVTVRFVNLINLLLDREIIPEMLQEKCTPDQLAKALESVLKKNKQDQVHQALMKLGVDDRQTPSEKMVQKIREMIRK